MPIRFLRSRLAPDLLAKEIYLEIERKRYLNLTRFGENWILSLRKRLQLFQVISRQFNFFLGKYVFRTRKRMWRSVLVLSVWVRSPRRWATSPTSLSTSLSSSFLFSLCQVAKSKKNLVNSHAVVMDSWVQTAVKSNSLKTSILNQLHFSKLSLYLSLHPFLNQNFWKKILWHQNNSTSFKNSSYFDFEIIEASKTLLIRNGCLRVFNKNL